MRSLFSSFLGYFLTPGGLVVLGALDASVIFFLPLGIDLALIVVTARQPNLFWAHALAATAGSVAGAGLTFWIGRKAGEKGLARWVRQSRLERVRSRVNGRAVAGIAALGLIPPPFPFTAFVLASGALGVETWKFLSQLALVRALRFGTEAALAARYGERITSWMDSTIFDVVVGGFIVLAVVGTIVSGVNAWRQSRSRASM